MPQLMHPANSRFLETHRSNRLVPLRPAMDLGVAASAVAAAGLKLLSALVTKSSCVEGDWNQRAKKVDLFGIWGGLMQDDWWFMKIMDDGWSASWRNCLHTCSYRYSLVFWMNNAGGFLLRIRVQCILGYLKLAYSAGSDIKNRRMLAILFLDVTGWVKYIMSQPDVPCNGLETLQKLEDTFQAPTETTTREVIADSLATCWLHFSPMKSLCSENNVCVWWLLEIYSGIIRSDTPAFWSQLNSQTLQHWTRRPKATIAATSLRISSFNNPENFEGNRSLRLRLDSHSFRRLSMKHLYKLVESFIALK